MCMFTFGHVAHGDQKRASDPLELELKAVFKHLKNVGI